MRFPQKEYTPENYGMRDRGKFLGQNGFSWVSGFWTEVTVTWTLGMVSKWALALKMTETQPPKSSCSNFPQWRASPEDNSYLRGCSNSQWPSVSFIGAKTQQIINYDFSQMISHIPHRHACALGRKQISQQQKVAWASRLQALCCSCSTSALGQEGMHSWNEAMSETRREMREGLQAERTEWYRSRGKIKYRN